MNETEKIARDICEFSGIFVTCEECCKTTGRICECIRYAARIWNKGYRKEGRGNAKDYGYAADSFYKDCPLPDVEKVKRGSWVDAYISGVHHYRCTSCGEYTEAIWHSNFDYNFCPNCGAKMDGEKEK